MAWASSSSVVIAEEDVIACCEGRRGWPIENSEVFITTDDGYAQNFTGPYLDAVSSLGVRPHLFLIGVALDPVALGNHPHLELDEGGAPRPLASPALLREAIDAGWTVGAHTWTHRDLTQLGQRDLHDELVECKFRIEDALQVPVRSFAWPWGRRQNVSEQAMSIVRGQYDAAFSTEGGATIGEPRDRYFIRRDTVDKWMSSRELRGVLAGGLDRARGVSRRGSGGVTA